MKLSQSRSQKTRSDILAAARQLFGAAGFEAVSIDQLAQAAGISKASVFAHFSDKQAILATLGIEDAQSLIDALRHQAASGIALTADSLITTYRPWLDYFQANPDFARLYLVQSGLVKSAESRAYVALCASHETVLAEGIATADPALARHAAFIARGAMAHFQQVLVYRLSGWIGSAQEADHALGEALDVWCHGVAVKTA